MKKTYGLLIGLCLAVICQAQKEKLAFNLSKSETYTQKTTSVIAITQSIDGQLLNIQATVGSTVSYKVTAIHDSVYDMEARYESLSLKMTFPTGTSEFSSEKPAGPDDILSAMLGTIKGKSFKVMMTKTGKIIAVSDIGSLFANLFDQLPQVPEQQRQPLLNQLLQSYGENALRANLEMTTALFPGREITKGEKWIVPTKLEAGMFANIITTYELKQVNDSSCFITGNAMITPKDTAAYTELNGVSLKYNLPGTRRSLIRIDRKSGWIRDAVITQELAGTVQTRGNSEIPETVIIPMTVKSEIAITR